MPRRRFSQFAVFFLEFEISHILLSLPLSSCLGLNVCAWWPEFLHAKHPPPSQNSFPRQYCRFPCISRELESVFVFICEMLTVHVSQKVQNFVGNFQIYWMIRAENFELTPKYRAIGHDALAPAVTQISGHNFTMRQTSAPEFGTHSPKTLASVRHRFSDARRKF